MLGPSGSGKSTLTLCLDGLIPHMVEGDYAGEVVVAGLVVRDSPVHLLAQEAGLVFQDPEAQFCTLTVEDEIAFGLENLGYPPEEIEAAIDRALALVKLQDHRGRRLSALSGGEKQRVALAAILAMGPRMLVLDEPSANLDPRATAELFALLEGLAAERTHTIVIIEHKLDELIEWIDTVLVLGSDGRLICRGDPRAVFYGYGEELAAAGIWRPQTVELVAAAREAGWDVPGNPLGVRETGAALVGTSGLMDRLRERSGGMPGRIANSHVRGGGSPAAVEIADGVDTEGVLLAARHLTFRYPGRSGAPPALHEVTMSVRRGGLLAIAGENGAGKSTLGGLLSGVLDPPRGSVFLEGRDVADMRGQSVSDRVGCVFQNPEHQFVSDTVLGELAFSLSPKAGRKGTRHLTASQRELAETWLDRLGLLPLAEASPYALSQGQKRRLSVAALLIRGQSALILDEPTLGQDEVQTDRLMAMMQEFRAAGGTVAMITHDMRLVAEYADALLILAGGRVVYEGNPAGFFARPELVEVSGLGLPPLGRLGAFLSEEQDVPGGLLTVRALLDAAGGT